MRELVYGLGREKPEHVGDLYIPPPSPQHQLPERVDLRTRLSAPWPVWWQGPWNTCTAQAIGGAVWYLALVGGEAFEPSRLFTYYNEESMEEKRRHGVVHDAPVFMYEGIASIKRFGVPSESLWSYDDAHFEKRPPPDVYAAARKHDPIHDRKVDLELEPMKACLAEGYPLTIGIRLYPGCDAVSTAATGQFPLPDKSGHPIGGHALLLVGYDDTHSSFIVRNSWGKKWGQQGYGALPFAFATDPHLSDATWTIRYRNA